MEKNLKTALQKAYDLMYRQFGYQDWWPGDTDFEICIGAILTQNTAWSNVEKAIENLKRQGALDPYVIHKMPISELANLIRPAGYFNIKAKRVKNFVNVLVEKYNGSIALLLEGTRDTVRKRLLAINGIGKETADSMMLYAGQHLSFVVDAYTKRIFSRHNWCRPDAEYDEIKALCENSLNKDVSKNLLNYWRDYHAQLVMVGKNYCRKSNPKCECCPLNPLLTDVNVGQLKNKKL
ncbi:MAG: endonuclease III domain-containing protein [Verrucomicrobiia bacterium]|jgi:endonuclease-3 related protein